MHSSQQRLRALKSQFGGPLNRLHFTDALEHEFRRDFGQGFRPVAQAAFLAVMALIVVVISAEALWLQGRLDAPVKWLMFGVEFPLMLALFVGVGRLRRVERLPTIMNVLMLFQCVVFTGVAVYVAMPGDPVPYLYEILVLYLLFLFFFTGVMFYPSVAQGLLCIALAAAGYHARGMPGSAIAHAVLFLVATAGMGMCVRYFMERILRRDFLNRAISIEAARLDPLTDLLNRRGFEDGVVKLLRQARRYQCPVGLLMVDLDNFKQVNDAMGHARGDELLVAVSRTLDDIARRPLDLVCRRGGDEFVVALYDIDEDALSDIADELDRRLDTRMHPWRTPSIDVGASIGAVWFAPDQQKPDPTAMLEVLDRALYEAKRKGKGRVSFQRTGVWDSSSTARAAPPEGQAGV